VFVLVAVAPLGRAEPPSVSDLVHEYLVLAADADAADDSARIARLRVLRQTWCCPEEVVPEIAAVLPQVESTVQRRELLETLGRLPTSQSSEILVDHLDDADPQVRIVVVRGLRRFASRIERRGVVDVPRDAQFPPQIDGLVPVLIDAAGDDAAEVRQAALWALADAKGSDALDEIRRHLDDPDDRVRLLAACLLTESGDESGLPILGAALQRIAREDVDHRTVTIFDIEQVLASLARITPDNPGPPPMNPLLASSMGRAEELRNEMNDLVDAWAVWWEKHQGSR
jgi:hypothetical protein